MQILFYLTMGAWICVIVFGLILHRLQFTKEEWQEFNQWKQQKED